MLRRSFFKSFGFGATVAALAGVVALPRRALAVVSTKSKVGPIKPYRSASEADKRKQGESVLAEVRRCVERDAEAIISTGQHLTDDDNFTLTFTVKVNNSIYGSAYANPETIPTPMPERAAVAAS